MSIIFPVGVGTAPLVACWGDFRRRLCSASAIGSWFFTAPQVAHSKLWIERSGRVECGAINRELQRPVALLASVVQREIKRQGESPLVLRRAAAFPNSSRYTVQECSLSWPRRSSDCEWLSLPRSIFLNCLELAPAEVVDCHRSLVVPYVTSKRSRHLLSRSTIITITNIVPRPPP